MMRKQLRRLKPCIRPQHHRHIPRTHLAPAHRPAIEHDIRQRHVLRHVFFAGCEEPDEGGEAGGGVVVDEGVAWAERVRVGEHSAEAGAVSYGIEKRG